MNAAEEHETYKQLALARMLIERGHPRLVPADFHEIEIRALEHLIEQRRNGVVLQAEFRGAIAGSVVDELNYQVQCAAAWLDEEVDQIIREKFATAVPAAG